MKKGLALLSFVFLLSFSGVAQSVQKGDFSANIASENWMLNGGTGTRTHIVFVKFVKPFASIPTVMVSLTGYEAASGKDGNVRVSIKPENISRDGFVIRVSTGSDSRVAGVQGSWFAWGK